MHACLKIQGQYELSRMKTYKMDEEMRKIRCVDLP